ncbi:MAG: preprotein translocase subunit YajC [Microthrixaceae bacterium]|nr:preprotein translocase subunit YajC [Microthrixaceae bacterium]MCO5312557.1 preprotein translocase subunit YajC [Microthrixaceae bacterium]HPB46290.1 preprotein translocase subunit YajC [Microthrixaceae bacterium]
MTTNLATLLAQNSSGGGLGALLPLIIFIPLLYMLIVPQRKQRKQHAELMDSLAVGDEVVTSGGIYGTISYIESDEPIVHLSVDTDAVIRVTRASIARKVSADAAEPDKS